MNGNKFIDIIPVLMSKRPSVIELPEKILSSHKNWKWPKMYSVSMTGKYNENLCLAAI